MRDGLRFTSIHLTSDQNMECVKNTIRTKPKASGTRELKCKCGSTRVLVELHKDDDGNFTWIECTCKKCFNLLFYTGA